MTATATANAAAGLVDRLRRIGWQVQQSSTRRADWLYRITTPNGDIFQIGKGATDEDVTLVELDLNASGFAEAERDHQLREQAEREQRAHTAPTLALADAVWNDGDAKPANGNGNGARSATYSGGLKVDVNWMLRPTKTPEMRTVSMTPEAAARALAERNTRNRALSAKRVAYFEEVIREGRWALTHQGVSFDTEGYVQDGQTRLQAIVNVGVAVPIHVWVGQPVANFPCIDTGTKRSASDTVYVMGEHTDSRTISASVKTLIAIDAFGGDAHIRERSIRVGNDRVGHALPKYIDGIKDALQTAKALRREMRRANLVGLVAAVYLLNNRLPDGYPPLKKFFEDVQWGDMVPRDSPASGVRRALQNTPHDRWYTAALLLKAWNKYAQGEPVKQSLVWKANEAFPATVFLPSPDDRQQALDLAV